MEILNITENGKIDLSTFGAAAIFGSVGTFYEFSVKIGRFEFIVFAEICDVNREDLDVEIMRELLGENGLFAMKDKYFNAIEAAIKGYVNENNENWRDSREDWADYYDELNNDKASL